MVLYIFSIFVFLFCSFTLFFRTDWPVWLKISGTALILIVSLKYVIYQMVGGAFFSPALPRMLILTLETLYGALFLLFFLLLLWDVYLLFNWLLAKTGFPVPRHLPSGVIKCVLVLLSLASGIWGVWETVRVPDVRTRELSLADFPCSLNGLRVVQLTDLHVGPLLKKDWLADVVARVNSLQPDLILMTGDYVDGHVEQVAGEIEPLADLRAKYGILAVSGNHEYYWNVTEWEDAIAKLGIEWLNNSHKSIEIPGEDKPLTIVGIPDKAALRYGFDGPNLEKALRDAPDGLRILLSHQPANADENLLKAALQLSGHTHGGVMFFLQPLIARFNNGFVNGLYERGNGFLHVSPGTGIWNGFSCRVGVPAEITLFILNCPSGAKQAAKVAPRQQDSAAKS